MEGFYWQDSAPALPLKIPPSFLHQSFLLQVQQWNHPQNLQLELHHPNCSLLLWAWDVVQSAAVLVNAWLMQWEPPQEGMNLQNEQDDKHIPDVTNMVLMWQEPPEEGTNLQNKQDDECVPQWSGLPGPQRKPPYEGMNFMNPPYLLTLWEWE